MNKTITKPRGRLSRSAMKKFSSARSVPAQATRTAPASAKGPLDADLLRKMDAWWRAANYLSVGQTYLYDNPLLKQPLKKEHVKPRLVGHWGTTPGLNFIYVHLNRVIKERDLNMIYIIGPGHGGPGIVANTWLEGTYSEVYPNIPADEQGQTAGQNHVRNALHDWFLRHPHVSTS
jgi:xylulose-5-phosphate/fructose-6-phosphate phosphoketolase